MHMPMAVRMKQSGGVTGIGLEVFMLLAGRPQDVVADARSLLNGQLGVKP